MTSNQIVGTDFFKWKPRPMSRYISMIQNPDLRADLVPFAEEQNGTNRAVLGQPLPGVARLMRMCWPFLSELCN